MKALVVGYGSIGMRHARVLAGLGAETAVVSRREVDHPQVFGSIADALSGFQPDYVVIASRTSEHGTDLAALAEAGFIGRVLVEKPLFDTDVEVPENRFERIRVAYNMRFYAALLRFRELLQGRRVYSVTAYTGSYLPSWRPHMDYRETSSARKTHGGGVLRELSHEIDYLLWMFGAWRRVAAIGGQFADLEIDTDDSFTLLFETAHVPAVTLQINYLDRTTRRDVLALTDAGSLRLDLIAGTVQLADGGIETFTAERDDSYIAEHTAMMNDDDDVICSLDEGIDVMHLILGAERAAHTGEWVMA
ncbi:MAG: Gfo/Idh/MocA family oxidoreductase [Rhodospirillales bacterium]|nr:Gfo/Idh/MocA family oxidoreductase [Rhodospirillales bacterium]